MVGGNRSTWRKRLTCCKSLKNFISWVEFKLTTSVVIGTDCIGSCKSNYHRSRPWRPQIYLNVKFYILNKQNLLILQDRIFNPYTTTFIQKVFEQVNTRSFWSFISNSNCTAIWSYKVFNFCIYSNIFIQTHLFLQRWRKLEFQRCRLQKVNNRKIPWKQVNQINYWRKVKSMCLQFSFPNSTCGN